MTTGLLGVKEAIDDYLDTLDFALKKNKPNLALEKCKKVLKNLERLEMDDKPMIKNNNEKKDR